MTLIKSFLDPYSTHIEGFVDIGLNPYSHMYLSESNQNMLFIPKSISEKTLPDHRGNFVTLKTISLFTPERYNECCIKNGNIRYTFHKTRKELGSGYHFDLSYFTYNEKDVSCNFLTIESRYCHPRFNGFYPIIILPFTKAYNGYKIDKAFNYIRSVKTKLFKKSFYLGPGKDERFFEVQKLDFDEPENVDFFSDILQVFSIEWIGENSDHYLSCIASSEGPGFYRIKEQYQIYSSQDRWRQIEDNILTNDILNWLKSKKMVPINW